MTDELVEVRLLGLPVPTWASTADHHADLVREFRLITASDDTDRAPLPAQLVALSEAVAARYRRFTGASRDVLEDALARGDETIDLVVAVPPDVRDAASELDRLLDAAEEHCRAGEALLTLAAPPESLAFRRWYLGEFVRQIAGEAPTPWPVRAG